MTDDSGPGLCSLIGELNCVAEQRGECRYIDAGRGKTILERGIGHDAGRARHGLDAVQRHQSRIADLRCR